MLGFGFSFSHYQSALVWAGRTLMNKDIKVNDNKQKPEDACPAQTEADSEPPPKITTSGPACSNTFVGCSFTV